MGAKKEAGNPMTLKPAEFEGSRAVFKAKKDAGGLDHIRYQVIGDELASTVASAPPPADKPDAKSWKPLDCRLQKGV